ncbi:MAG: hypothetical protein IJ733_14990 [Lachnospiraceae bacterium]|nr:hypothetical protein [Lachnospiraceae bacterium]
MNFSKNQHKVLSKLIDQYERSTTFQGKNKIHQNFSVQIGKMFPKYLDDAEYDFFVQINEEMESLCAAHLVQILRKNGRIEKVVLGMEHLKETYQALGRTPRDEWQGQMLQFLDGKEKSLQNSSACRFYEIDKNKGKEGKKAALGQNDELKEIYKSYIKSQRERIAENKSVEYFDDWKGYRDLWEVLLALLELEGDIYIRDLSVRLFHDSKKLEPMRSKIEALLFQYGEYPEKNLILEECGVIQTPSYVMIKGNATLFFEKQEMNLKLLHGDIGFSTESLVDIEEIRVHGNRVITIENLTSFHRFPCSERDVVIYLGGYHNLVKRIFLEKIYRDNPNAGFFHFGDLDAGGFYIYEHLKRKTGIPFQTIYMDKEVLMKYQNYGKKLTSNDRVRIQRLLEKYQKEGEEEHVAVLQAMLDLDCKLEQEAVEV